MKILDLILEILTSPFSILLRNSNGVKGRFSFLVKPIFVFLLAALIVLGLVLFTYRDFIF